MNGKDFKCIECGYIEHIVSDICDFINPETYKCTMCIPNLQPFKYDPEQEAEWELLKK